MTRKCSPFMQFAYKQDTIKKTNVREYQF